jgi:hypothetical protein
MPYDTAQFDHGRSIDHLARLHGPWVTVLTNGEASFTIDTLMSRLPTVTVGMSAVACD